MRKMGFLISISLTNGLTNNDIGKGVYTMTTTENIINVLMEAAEALYFVEKDGDRKTIRIDADYRETNEWLLPKAFEAVVSILENRHSSNEYPEKDFLYRMTEQIYANYQWDIWDIEDAILKHAADTPELTDDDEDLRQILWDTLSIEPDYEHFLSQTMKVNLIFATDEEQNLDCNLVSEQGDALLREDKRNILSIPSGLSRLLEAQGYTMKDLRNAMDSYQKHGYPESKQDKPQFLLSLCQELENHTYSMGCITVLAEMTMYELAKLLRNDTQITFPTNAMLGIYNSWNGSGSLLEIELEKPLTLSSKDIFKIQIEGSRYCYEYTVDQTYGLIGSCWKPVSLTENK